MIPTIAPERATDVSTGTGISLDGQKLPLEMYKRKNKRGKEAGEKV